MSVNNNFSIEEQRTLFSLLTEYKNSGVKNEHIDRFLRNNNEQSVYNSTDWSSMPVENQRTLFLLLRTYQKTNTHNPYIDALFGEKVQVLDGTGATINQGHVMLYNLLAWYYKCGKRSPYIEIFLDRWHKPNDLEAIDHNDPIDLFGSRLLIGYELDYYEQIDKDKKMKEIWEGLYPVNRRVEYLKKVRDQIDKSQKDLLKRIDKDDFDWEAFEKKFETNLEYVYNFGIAKVLKDKIEPILDPGRAIWELKEDIEAMPL